MDFRERALYHQIHPVKLLTDGLTALGAAALLWKHRPTAAFLLGFVPSVLVSALMGQHQACLLGQEVTCLKSYAPC